jgi:hypothetical protein
VYYATTARAQRAALVLHHRVAHRAQSLPPALLLQKELPLDGAQADLLRCALQHHSPDDSAAASSCPVCIPSLSFVKRVQQLKKERVDKGRAAAPSAAPPPEPAFALEDAYIPLHEGYKDTSGDAEAWYEAGAAMLAQSLPTPAAATMYASLSTIGEFLVTARSHYKFTRTLQRVGHTVCHFVVVNMTVRICPTCCVTHEIVRRGNNGSPLTTGAPEGYRPH